MALKELLKQRVMEKLNFSQEISDEHLKEMCIRDRLITAYIQSC